MVKILHFHHRGCRFDPWSGNQDPTCHAVQLKNGKKLSGGPMVKNLPANAGDTGSILGTGGFHLSGATKRMLHSY